MLVRRIARPMLAAMFVVGGLSQLRRPAAKPKATPLGLMSPHRIHPTWKNFLDMAYWNVELK